MALLGFLGVAVAVVAAVRSTWSPCGLSMLSTITPIGERARGHRYPVTAAWFIAGAALGGATLGALAGLVGQAVHPFLRAPAAAEALALTAAVIALASDSNVGGFALPIHRRQVNERWLDEFRPWVYGSGFGWQIGAGVATYIMTASVYLLVVFAILLGDPLVAVALGIVFGGTRGLAVLLTCRISNPAALASLHRRFDRAGPVAAKTVVAVELAVALTLAAVVWAPAVAIVIVGGLVTLVGSGRLRRPSRADLAGPGAPAAP